MRVYLPSTLPALAAAMATGEIATGPHPGFAVTPALREWYEEGREEELEYAAMAEAARASLRLLGADPTIPRRRVVVAVEVDDKAVALPPGGELSDRGSVQLTGSVPVAKVVSAHVDDVIAESDVAAAVAALPTADEGDEDAQFTVDGAEGHELMWYATQELPDLVSDFTSR
ncbi:MAG: hypothetical protein GEV03_10065 [Streptosporangiales bacterium]|nr:hypothetical protein [Streptosporangiales bacterium]